ncbi:jg652, partial [Pararge aegeria aegeria]
AQPPWSERDGARPTHHAGDKRPVVKQKECWLRRFEAPAPLPAL